MVDKFIQELTDLCTDCFNGNVNHIFFLGLTKLIDIFSRSSKAEMREKFFKIKDDYNEDGEIFFELFPEYKNMKGITKNDYSSFELMVYNLKTTENGLNLNFDDYRRMDKYALLNNEFFNSFNNFTFFKKLDKSMKFNIKFMNSFTNCDLFKKLYAESYRINKNSLNAYNISSYDLSSFSKAYHDASKLPKDYKELRENIELQKIVEDYFGGFDINTFFLLSYFEGDLFIDIYINRAFDVFEKLNNIELDNSIFEDQNKLECFLSEFIIKVIGKQYNDNILFIISLFNMDLINESKSRVFIPSNNPFSFIVYFMNTILSKKSFNYDLEVFTDAIFLTPMDRMICSLIKNVKFVDMVDDEFLNNIDLVASNENIKNPSIFNHFKNKKINPISFVSSFKYDDCNYENFEQILNNDNLDCVFLLKDHDPMVILNSNKPDERKNKFLIYDGLVNNHADEELDLIVDSYKFFNEGKYSKLFLNEYIDNSSFKKHFNFSNLMYDKFSKSHNIEYKTENDEKTLKKSFDNDDIDVCLGDIANLETIQINYELKDGVLYVKDCIDLKNSLLLIPDFDSNWTYTNERIKRTDDSLKNVTHALICKLTSKDVLKEFIYYYLNSDRGISSLNYFKRVMGTFEDDLKYLRIPIPDINTQRDIVDTAIRMDVFFTNMEIFKNDFNKNILNYEPALRSLSKFTCSIEFDEEYSISDMCSNWRVVYSGILWPLAITYLYATKKSNKNLNKKELYVHLFEFFAAFNVIVLLSAIPHYKQDECKKQVWKKVNDLDRVSFGTWKYLYELLIDFYNNNEFDTDIDKSILNNIASKKYLDVFSSLNTKRNRYKGHDGSIIEDDDKNLVKSVEELEVYINNDMLQIMKEYSGLKMYYTTGKNITKDRNKGTIKQELLVLNGPCSPQFYYDITLNIEDELESNCLYLYDPSKTSFLQINDNLMKLFKDEETGEWLLYVYDGFKRKKKGKIKIKSKCHQRFNKYKNYNPDDSFKEILNL